MKTKQGTERTIGGKVIMILLDGQAPDCPACGNGNAMLNDAVEYNGIYRWGVKCRDCGFRLDEGEFMSHQFANYHDAAIAIDEGFFDELYPDAAIEISDEAILIGNMVTLMLETIYEENHASDVIDKWRGIALNPRKNGFRVGDVQREINVFRGRFEAFGWDAMMIQTFVEMTIGQRAAFEIKFGLHAAYDFDGTESGEIV